MHLIYYFDLSPAKVITENVLLMENTLLYNWTVEHTVTNFSIKNQLQGMGTINNF